jgi:small basic protein (TIGR04137 family)
VFGVRLKSDCRRIAFDYYTIPVFCGPNTEHRTPNTEMSIDKSLKRKGGMAANRCVMKRTERILKMMEDGKWTDATSPFGIPKTRVQKVVLKKKAKAEKAEGEAGAAAAPGAAPAAGAAAAAKPAAGGEAKKK